MALSKPTTFPSPNAVEVVGQRVTNTVCEFIFPFEVDRNHHDLVGATSAHGRFGLLRLARAWPARVSWHAWPARHTGTGAAGDPWFAWSTGRRAQGTAGPTRWRT